MSDVLNRHVMLRIAILCFILPLWSAPGEGRKVRLTMTDGRAIEGELLLVRPESFVISTTTGLQEKELRQHPENIIEQPIEDVINVKFDGTSLALPAMVLGLVGGAVAGWAIWEALDDDPEKEPAGFMGGGGWDAAGGSLIGIFAGVTGGALIGGSMSAGGDEYNANAFPDMDQFRQFARYDEEEPDFLIILLR